MGLPRSPYKLDGRARCSNISRRDRIYLTFVSLSTRIGQVPLYALAVLLMRYVGGYSIENINTLRADYRALVGNGRPLIICANHLTWADSAIITWAFGANLWYLTHFSRLPWNIPAHDFFGRFILCRALAPFAKCIFLDREGSAREKYRVMKLCDYLLQRGDTLVVFPEGRRSRIGRFERGRVRGGGLARWVAGNANCLMLCVHLRADRQHAFSDWPPRGSVFRFGTRVIDPLAEGLAPLSSDRVSDRVCEAIESLERSHHATSSVRGP